MSYPTTIDVYITLVDNIDTVAASHVNERNTAIVNIETALQASLAGVSIPGDIRMWAGSIADIPSGWLHCNGDSLNVEDQVALYTAIGVQYGGSVSLIDSSSSAHTITSYGSVAASAAQLVFGNASIKFGVGNYVTIPDSADWSFGSGDLTIECFARFGASTAHTIFFHRTDNSNYCAIYPILSSNYVNFLLRISATFEINIVASYTFSLNTWYHIAVVRYGNDWNVYINGTSYGSATYSGSYPDFSEALFIGVANISGTPSQYMQGNLDEVRISKGIARYTANFTPPTAAFTDDAYTVLLLHGDLSGTFTLPDFRDTFPIGAKEDSGGIAKTNITGSLAKTGGSITSNSGGGGEASTGGGNGDIGSHTHTMVPPYVAFAFMVKT